MTRRKKILLVGLFILVGQTFIFRDYISPVQWGQIKVNGLACTCPDETVVNGQTYLKFITPDSLKEYDLDFSEIYVTERPSTELDPMGTGLYIIKGQVIGKDRVSEYDPWNPKIKIESWSQLNFFYDLGVKVLMVVELLIFVILLKNKKADSK